MELLHKTDAFAESVARFAVGVCYIAKQVDLPDSTIHVEYDAAEFMCFVADLHRESKKQKRH